MDEPVKDEGNSAEDRARAAEERARLLETRLEVERCARRAGAVDEDAVYRLLDLTAIEYDAAGSPANVDTLVTRLLEERPWLRARTNETSTAGTVSAPVSPANPPRDGARLLTRDAIRRMTPEQINANWEAIEAALKRVEG